MVICEECTDTYQSYDNFRNRLAFSVLCVRLWGFGHLRFAHSGVDSRGRESVAAGDAFADSGASASGFCVFAGGQSLESSKSIVRLKFGI